MSEQVSPQAESHVSEQSNPQPVVTIVSGKPEVMSVDVATHFEKPHNRVLQSIRSILKTAPDDVCLSNFRQAYYEVDTPQGGKAQYPAYLLSRDAFSLVAMGFTGKKALDWKIRYIQAFNAMESRLAEGTPAEPNALSTATKEERRPLVDAVRTWVRLTGADYALAHRQVNAIVGVSSIENMRHDHIQVALAWVRSRIEAVVKATEAKALAGADEIMVAIERLELIIKKVREVTKGLPVAMEVQLMRHFLNKAGYPVD